MFRDTNRGRRSRRKANREPSDRASTCRGAVERESVGRLAEAAEEAPDWLEAWLSTCRCVGGGDLSQVQKFTVEGGLQHLLSSPPVLIHLQT